MRGPLFPVSERKRRALAQRLEALGIREEDLEEEFVRSRGPGGQKVNKTSTCVHLRHLPTGITVKCMTERTQALNRYRARLLLADKVEALLKGRQAEEARRIARLRRQKLKRSKRAKEKLRLKRLTAEKKRLRAPVREAQD